MDYFGCTKVVAYTVGGLHHTINNLEVSGCWNQLVLLNGEKWEQSEKDEYLPKEGSELTFYDAGILGAERLTVEPLGRGACREGVNSMRNCVSNFNSTRL